MDLLASLRGIPGVTAEAVEIDLDPGPIARVVAEHVAEEIRENMGRGVAPDGGAMPPPDDATIRRRGPGPRGLRTGRLLRSIHAEPRGDGTYVVTADEVAPGQMAKTLGDPALWRAQPGADTYRAGLAQIVKKR